MAVVHQTGLFHTFEDVYSKLACFLQVVTFVTKYHKGYAMSGDVKIIFRYLPREVGELVVWYLWLVLPFQFGIERRFYWSPKKPREGERVNGGEDGQDGQDGQDEQDHEQDDGQVEPSREGPAPPSVSSHLWPADHRGRKVTSARMRETLKRYSREHLGEVLTIAAYREIAIAISRRFMRDCDAFMADQDGIDEEGAGDGEQSVGRRLQAVIDQQAGHTSHVAGQIYARLMEEMGGAVASTRERFRIASRMWHLWLGFVSAEDQSETHESTGIRKRKRIETPWEAIAQERRRARELLLRSVDPEQELRRMLGSDVRFRGEQKRAIEAIVRGVPRVVVVMPTGEGKSLLFQLPAFIAPSGMTIVVVPLIELRRDKIRRCEQVGIVAREWEENRQVDDATVVFVTPESAAGGGLNSFMNRNRRKVDRMVIDECHVMLNRRSSFRREMARVGRLVRAEAQMILVTATLPPSRQDELYERVYWTGLEVSEFRMRTVRRNIRYSVQVVERTGERRVDETAWDDSVVRIAEAKLRQHRPGKVIVYA